MTDNIMLKAALAYRNKFNLNIIPSREKRACVKWTEYQTRFVTEDEINQWWGKDFLGAGISLVCGELSNVTVLDFDLHETDKFYNEFLAINNGDLSPISKTPRGGLHCFYQYMPGINNIQLKGLDIKTEGGLICLPPTKNEYGGYEWVTNIKNTEIGKMPDAIFKYINSININNNFLKDNARARSNDRANDGNTGSQTVTSGNISFNKGGRDSSLFHVANCLVKGGMPYPNVRDCLFFLGSHCSPPFSESEIEKKVESAVKRFESGVTNVAEEVRDFIEVTTGNFRVTEVQQAVTGGNKSHNKAILMALSRLVKQNIIERIQNQSGTYRKIESQFDATLISDVEQGQGIKFRLPFGFEQYVDIFEKDLICFAGTPNVGKSAIMMEILRLNMRDYKCHYFSSEMGKKNFKNRISKHKETSNWPAYIVDDFPNFVDVIQPDDVNFIDYVETKEPYDITDILRNIQRKLRKGIAVVALQKNKDQPYAIGGLQTTAKASIFMTIDPEYPYAELRAVKAKNYKDINPNGFIMKFKIVDGINLRPAGIWEPEC